MADCDHPVQMHGLCAICGLDLIENENFESGDLFTEGTNLSGIDAPNLHILHTNPHIKVSPQEAARIETANMERLLKAKKLSLVVDLDQTVLHATVDSSVHEWLNDSSHPFHQHTQDIHRVALHDCPHVYYVKLRPGLQQFFEELSKIFELHVYTMGSRSYAHAVVKLFDVEGKLFGDRILSRDDNEIIENRKKLSRIFPTDDRMVLVIDDRVDVWGECGNLVQVPAYTFFLGTGDVNAPGRIDGEIGVQEHTKSTVINSNDQVLFTILRVLKSVHNIFFEEFTQKSENDREKLPNVKEILSKIKSGIFQNFSFVFSGLLSQNFPFEEQEIWKLSKEFGANCEIEINEKTTTHLISNRIDTEKALQAQELDIPVVKPEWIYECFKNWKQIDWSVYKLEIVGKRRRRENKRSFDEIEDDFIDKDNDNDNDNDDYDDIFEDGDFNNDDNDDNDDADDDDDEEDFMFQNSSTINLNFDAADLEEIQKELEDLEDEESENDSVNIILNDSVNISVSVDEIYSELDKELDITSIHSADNELLTNSITTDPESDLSSNNKI